mgnify:CR=1 FL=1
MNKAGAMLSARILAELKELSTLVERIQEGWERSKLKSDDYYLDGVALNLHGFYSGLERIFEKTASLIDGNVPSGANWHQELLNQMSIEIPGVRPAVISSELKDLLEDYRGFRHVVRNVYTYHLNPEKMEPLGAKLRKVFEQSDAELTAFARFLQSI